MSLSKFSWKASLALLLAAFFLMSSIGNIVATGQIAADYSRWGYPDWFHYVTGLLELAAALLLAIRPFRFWGAALSATVMVGASATVLLHGEYVHAIAALTVLAVAITVGWLNKSPQPTVVVS